jgi:hypothetical protein
MDDHCDFSIHDLLTLEQLCFSRNVIHQCTYSVVFHPFDLQVVHTSFGTSERYLLHHKNFNEYVKLKKSGLPVSAQSSGSCVITGPKLQK